MSKKNHPSASDKEKVPTPDMNAEETSSVQPENETVSDEQAAANDAALENLQAELAAEKDKYLRLAAEYDNYRKRSQKEREALYVDIRSDTIMKLLPVYDNLARALAIETTDAPFYKGVEMTMTQLKDILEKLGVREIPAVGEQFDPTVHNAVMHIEDDSVENNIIVEEFQKGFALGEKIIRFSMVKVAN